MTKTPSPNEQELRAKIESLQFTLMTPSSVTVTLGESQLTDDIMHIFAKQREKLLEEVDDSLEYMEFTDKDNSVNDCFKEGFNHGIAHCKIKLDSLRKGGKK